MSDKSEFNLAQELEEEQALRERLGQILHDTSNALHGGPKENGLWSFHDLPELAMALRGRKSIWRVTWMLATTGICQSTVYDKEDNAVGWAEGLLKGGARDVVVTELIVGRTIHFNSDKNLFQK